MEHSEDKTKRELIKLLTNQQWKYQYSIFFDVSSFDVDTAKDLAISWLDDFNDIKFRDYLRKVSDTAILFVIRTGLIRNRFDKKVFKQVYITMYCNKHINLDDVVSRYYTGSYDSSINVMSRKVTESKLNRTISTLNNQRLHDLSFLSNKKRYSLINRKLLIEKT